MVPDKICPVIMPGSEMIPIPSMEFKVGKSAVSMALLAKGVNIFLRCYPHIEQCIYLQTLRVDIFIERL